VTRPLRTTLSLAVAAALSAVLVSGGASATTPASITTVDLAGYPTVRATIVTATPTTKPPQLRENGRPVTGFEATNLGAEKSIVLIVDRSQSMRGQAIRDASAAARAFVRAKPAGDRIAVVAVGKRPIQLTQFATAGKEAEDALAGLEVDAVRGTALYDSIVLSADALAGDRSGARVIVLLTDGQEVSSDTSLGGAIDAARDAGVTVYPIGIESASFRPAPLERLARETGGRYQGAAGTKALQAIYVSLAQELRRTWHVSYVTAARPGEKIAVASGSARAEVTAPGRRSAETGSSIPEPLFRAGPVFVATFVGLCVLIGFAVLIKGPAGSRLRRRIDPHLGRADAKLSRGPTQERFATASTIMRLTESAFGQLKIWHRLHRLLERADLPLRTVELVYISLGVGAVGGILALLLGGGLFVLLLAFAATFMLPILFVAYKARKRLTVLEDQLPDLLITLAASLKAGHSFRQGIQAVVDEGQPPASTEFKRVLTETRLGRPMDAALQDMGDRVGSKNLSFVITAVTIQRQVGGSLAGIFDMVAEAVRQRQQFARKIRSLTAMGRASAYVLVGLPFFMLGVLTLMNREYMEPLYNTSTGHKLMILGVVMMAVGSLLLRKIVSFRG
jgi:tight adherence protein B